MHTIYFETNSNRLNPKRAMELAFRLGPDKISFVGEPSPDLKMMAMETGHKVDVVDTAPVGEYVVSTDGQEKVRQIVAALLSKTMTDTMEAWKTSAHSSLGERDAQDLLAALGSVNVGYFTEAAGCPSDITSINLHFSNLLNDAGVVFASSDSNGAR